MITVAVAVAVVIVFVFFFLDFSSTSFFLLFLSFAIMKMICFVWFGFKLNVITFDLHLKEGAAEKFIGTEFALSLMF